jgi:hypothetical protein
VPAPRNFANGAVEFHSEIRRKLKDDLRFTPASEQSILDKEAAFVRRNRAMMSNAKPLFVPVVLRRNAPVGTFANLFEPTSRFL